MGITDGLLTATWAQRHKKPGTLTSPVSNNVADNGWHTARLNVTKWDVTLELDEWASDPSRHGVESFDLNDNVIYLGKQRRPRPRPGVVIYSSAERFFSSVAGGVPDEKKHPANDDRRPREDLFKGNFRGCVEQLTVQQNVITDFKHYESVNVDVCDTW